VACVPAPEAAGTAGDLLIIEAHNNRVCLVAG
jgi:hypothetical protein